MGGTCCKGLLYSREVVRAAKFEGLLYAWSMLLRFTVGVLHVAGVWVIRRMVRFVGI